MAHGPQAGLAILDRLADEGRLSQWPQLHIARAELLRQLGRPADALSAYQAALDTGPHPAEREFISRRISGLAAAVSRPQAVSRTVRVCRRCTLPAATEPPPSSPASAPTPPSSPAVSTSAT